MANLRKSVKKKKKRTTSFKESLLRYFCRKEGSGWLLVSDKQQIKIHKINLFVMKL
jgi:hypothetical protein